MSVMNSFGNLKVSRKLFFGFSTVLLVTLAILASGMIGINSIQDRVEKNEHTTGLFNALSAVRLARLNYGYTQDPKYLDQTNVAAQHMQEMIATLETYSWTPEGKVSVDNTDNAVKNYMASLTPFTKAVGEKKESESKLSTQNISDNSEVASQLSHSNTLTTQQALVASQVAFIMSDIDTQTTQYKLHPTDELKHGLMLRLNTAKSSCEELLQVVPEDQKPG